MSILRYRGRTKSIQNHDWDMKTCPLFSFSIPKLARWSNFPVWIKSRTSNDFFRFEIRESNWKKSKLLTKQRKTRPMTESKISSICSIKRIGKNNNIPEKSYELFFVLKQHFGRYNKILLAFGFKSDSTSSYDLNFLNFPSYL